MWEAIPADQCEFRERIGLRHARRFAPSPSQETVVIFSTPPPPPRKRGTFRVDWAGLLTEHVLVDTIMHTKRIHEPKTVREVDAPDQFGAYVAGLAATSRAPAPGSSPGSRSR